jgi:hypothetical protein
MKHILVWAAFLLLTVSAYAQTAVPQPCTLKLSQAPAVRGVKLDMTLDELFSLFPGLSDRVGSPANWEGYPNFGVTSFAITPSNYSTQDRFAGIDQFYVTLFDRRAVALAVNYPAFPKGARWRNTDELVQIFSESLHLPSYKSWAAEETYPQRRLNCDGFQIAITAADERAHIRFENKTKWEQTQKDRLAAFEEQKRREFKP